MTADAEPGDLVQGTLHMLILKTLTLEPLHGYGIGVRLEQISDRAFRVNAGSLFPGLRRLERDGLIRGEWRVTENNRRAKYYHLTPQGRARLRRETRQWEAQATAIARILAVTPEQLVMAAFHRFIGGLKGLMRSRRVEQELDDELRTYLESSVEARVRAGMTPEDARRAARVELGSIEAVKDQTRGVGWEATVEQAWRDVRYGARTLRRSPTFAAVVVLTLTLGIGANTAIFSAVNAIMLRTLPVAHPEELISLEALYPDGAEPFSYAAYRTIAADGAHLVDALAASTARRDTILVDGPPEPVDLKWVSGNYFTALGVSTSVGRPLLVSDDLQPPGRAVAVISDAFWARRFGHDPAAVGRTVRLRGTAFVDCRSHAPRVCRRDRRVRVSISGCHSRRSRMRLHGCGTDTARPGSAFSRVGALRSVSRRRAPGSSRCTNAFAAMWRRAPTALISGAVCSRAGSGCRRRAVESRGYATTSRHR